MHNTLLSHNDGKRVFTLILDAGEEVFACLSRFADEQAMPAASITAIGAFERATIGFFDFETKSYEEIPSQSSPRC